MMAFDEGKTVDLKNTVDAEEQLFRVVKRSRPDCITVNKTVSPALYKDSNGVSVDRDGGRNKEEIARFITEVTFPKRAKAIASVYASDCYDVGARVEAAPSETNPYHANIHLDTNEEKGNLQALQLADASCVIYFNDAVEWT